MSQNNPKSERIKIPLLIEFFLPLTPMLFFLTFFFQLLDFLPHEILDWLNIFLDSESVAYYFSPLFIYLFLSFGFVLTGLVVFFETALVCSQHRIKCSFPKIIISSLNSLSFFIVIYLFEWILSISFILLSSYFPSILDILNLSLLELVIRTIRYLHIFLASLILIYVQFFLPIYLRIGKIGLAFGIFMRRIKRSFFYPINIILYVIFIYSSTELFSLIINSNLKFLINNNELFLFYKTQISSIETIKDIFISFGFFGIILGTIVFFSTIIYNFVYVLGRKLINRSLLKN